jgi:hypothetical protein
MRMCFLVMPEWHPNQHHRDGTIAIAPLLVDMRVLSVRVRS